MDIWLSGSNLEGVRSILKLLGTKTAAEDGSAQSITLADDPAQLTSGKGIAIAGEPGTLTPFFSQMGKKLTFYGAIYFSSKSSLSGSPGDDILRRFIESPYAKAPGAVVAGLRAGTGEEHAYLKARRIRTFNMQHLAREGLSETAESLMVNARHFPAFIILIDIGVVDPAFVPAATTKEPGGLTARELFELVMRLRRLKEYKGGAITGFDLRKDHDQLTASLIAKLAIELGVEKRNDHEDPADWE